MYTVKVGGLVGIMKNVFSSTPKLGFPVKEFPPKCMYCVGKYILVGDTRGG